MKRSALAKLAVQLGVCAVAVSVGGAPAVIPGSTALSKLFDSILGNWATDLLNRFPLPRRLRRFLHPLGQPNHDLNLALQRAIRNALDEFDLDKYYRDKTNSYRDLEAPYHAKVEDYCRKLEQHPEDFIQIEAGNTALKDFLENPNPETFQPFSEFLDAEALQGIPADVRLQAVQELYTLIAARFWDEVKNTSAAWNAYAAEVFKEFREYFSDIRADLTQIGETQEQILARLDARRQELLPAEGEPSSLPPKEVVDAIEFLQKGLSERLDAIREQLVEIQKQLGQVQRGVSDIQTEQKGQGRNLWRILVGVVVLALMIISGFWWNNHRQTEIVSQQEETNRKLSESEKVTVAKIRAGLLENSESAKVNDLREAGAKMDWQERQRLVQAAEEAHQQRVSRIDRVVRILAELEGGTQAIHVFNEMTRIVDEQGVDQALAYLDNQRISILEEARTAKDAQRDELRPLLWGTMLAESTGDNVQAESLFEDVLEVDPGWHEARHLYWTFLVYSKGSRARSHEHLAAAQAVYQLATRHALALVHSEPDNLLWLRDLSMIHERLGSVAESLGNLNEAAGFFGEALRIAEKMVKMDEDNDIWWNDLSSYYVRLGYVEKGRGNLDEAHLMFEGALQITKWLAESEPDNKVWLDSLAMCYASFGDLAKDRRELAEARQYFSNALQVAEKLAESDPDNKYRQHNLLAVHLSLGNVARNEDLAGVRRHFEEALRIVEKLTESDPDNRGRQINLMASHQRLGNMAESQGELAEATRHFKGVLQVAEKLVESDSGNKDWQHNLLAVHMSLGDAARNEDLAETRRHFEEALRIAEKLAESDPDNKDWQLNLLTSRQRLGDMAESQGELAEARRHFEEALRVAEKLAESDPGNKDWQHNLLAVHLSLGSVARSEDLAEARRHFEEALRISEKLEESDSDNKDWQLNLMASHQRLGNIAESQGELAEATRHFEDVLRIKQKLANADEDNEILQRNMAVSHVIPPEFIN